MLIDGISIPKDLQIQYQDGREEILEVPDFSNDMIYEINDFIDLIETHTLNHPFLPYSEMELQVMDEVRKQQGIVFPADQ